MSLKLYSRRMTALGTLSGILIMTGVAIGAGERLSGKEVPCQLEATMDRTEVNILSNGKTHWSGAIEKNETKTVLIPEGPFTVVSKVYNPNLKTQEDIRTDAHTRMCREQVALSVPLFSPPE